MQRVPQDSVWHPEGDVWVHAGLAGDQGARLADEAGLTGTDRLVIVFAALLHDLGKVTHTQLDVGDREWTGTRITSHGHAAAGREPARLFLNSIGCPREIKHRILPLVVEHMSTVQPPTKPACRRLVRRLEPATLTELHLVVGADRKGRGNPDAPNDADSWLEMGKDLTIAVQARRGILTGKHLIDYGMYPGPAFKSILAYAVECQDDGAFDDEAGAVRWLHENY
jgi:tRNA nucleotidyltransferase (CCA-adding enzyme)